MRRAAFFEVVAVFAMAGFGLSLFAAWAPDWPFAVRVAIAAPAFVITAVYAGLVGPSRRWMELGQALHARAAPEPGPSTSRYAMCPFEIHLQGRPVRILQSDSSTGGPNFRLGAHTVQIMQVPVRVGPLPLMSARVPRGRTPRVYPGVVKVQLPPGVSADYWSSDPANRDPRIPRALSTLAEVGVKVRVTIARDATQTVLQLKTDSEVFTTQNVPRLGRALVGLAEAFESRPA